MTGVEVFAVVIGFLIVSAFCLMMLIFTIQGSRQGGTRGLTIIRWCISAAWLASLLCTGLIIDWIVS